MIRVLLVDDEKKTRDALVTHIPWATLGVDIVGTARNGLDALESMTAQPADLVLCDVRMPKMDGVELSKRLRTGWPSCEIIFLSGYSDKEYLKTAIQVHALAYIDKPLNIPEIGTIVATAVQSVLSRRIQVQQAELVSTERRELEPLRRRQLAESLLAGGGSSEATALLGEGPYRVVVLQPRRPLALPDFIATLNARSTVGATLITGQDRPDQAVVILNAAWAGDSARIEALCAELEALARDQTASAGAASFTAGPALTAGVSPHLNTLDDLPAALLQARLALDDSFYHPGRAVFFRLNHADRRFAPDPAIRSRLEQAAAAGDTAAACRDVALAMDQAKNVLDEDTHRVRQSFVGLLSGLPALVPGWTAAEAEAGARELARQITTSPNLEHLEAMVRDWLFRHFPASPDQAAQARRIERGRLFIRSRLADPDLDIETIAGHLQLSESYLCTLFKVHAGTTIREYLMQLRVTRARELLTSGNEKLQAIAHQVGFRDPNYFCTVFKRETGLTPGEYRTRHQP